MLRKGAAVAAVMIWLVLTGMSTAAAADPPVTCPPGTVPDPSTGQCVISVTAPPPPDHGGAGAGGGTTTPVTDHKCLWLSTEMPCARDGGYWSNQRDCYIGKPVVDYAPTSSIWQGHYPDGAIYSCDNPFLVGTHYYDFWSATPPAGPAAPPDPRDLARQAIARMNIHAINIGIVPEPRAGSIGIIGMPTWMWARSPGTTTWGPQTQSASMGGFTVTATAKAQRTLWTMGDGATVTCTGPGTPYADSYGKRSSPDCGHTYTRQGTYTVRATTYWVVTWAGIGQSGTIPLDLTDTTTITMGEAQVLSN